MRTFAPYPVPKAVYFNYCTSQCVGRSGATDARLLEAGNINKSLLMLGQVIQKLSSGDKKQHVNYRDSKIARHTAVGTGT